jgi:hypothetical protein
VVYGRVRHARLEGSEGVARRAARLNQRFRNGLWVDGVSFNSDASFAENPDLQLLFS